MIITKPQQNIRLILFKNHLKSNNGLNKVLMQKHLGTEDKPLISNKVKLKNRKSNRRL